MNESINIRFRSRNMSVILVLFSLISGVADAGFSGDLQIDIALGSAYTIRAGGSGGAVDRVGNEVACNSAGAHALEFTCPNDATYTPAAATGGYQAWGVGLNPILFRTQRRTATYPLT